MFTKSFVVLLRNINFILYTELYTLELYTLELYTGSTAKHLKKEKKNMAKIFYHLKWYC